MDELIRLKTDRGEAQRNLRSLEQRVPRNSVLIDGNDIVLSMPTSAIQYAMQPLATTMDGWSIVGQEYAA